MQQAHEVIRSQSAGTVRRIWAEVLNRPQDEIEPGCHFFALGGNSLLALVLQVKLESALNGAYPVSGIFQHPVFADFLAWLLDQHVATRQGTGG